MKARTLPRLLTGPGRVARAWIRTGLLPGALLTAVAIMASSALGAVVSELAGPERADAAR